jgi:DNA-binding NarL/FixJ family response regulator
MGVLSGLTFDSVLIVDDDRRYLNTNARGAKLLGATCEMVLNRAIDDFTSAQFEHLLPELWGALERDGTLRGAYEVLRGDGSIGMIEFAAQRDIHDGQHLIVARDLPREGPHSRPVGFALVDPLSGDIEEASPECCRLVGRSRNALQAAGLRVFGGKRTADRTMQAIRAIADGNRPSASFDCEVQRPGGGVQRLAVTLRPLFGAGTQPIRILLEAIPLTRVTGPSADPLSAREREVLQLMANGGTAETIAERLVLSPGTVRTHLRNIYSKLRVRDRAAAVATGIRRGYIE